MAWLDKARTELTDNPRLRVGLIVIGTLLLLYQLAGLSDLRGRMIADLVDKQTQLVRVQSISKEDGWDRRAAEIHTTLEALQAEIPESDSLGLAQATMQGWLRDLVIRSGTKLRITMGTPVQAGGPALYWKIPAQISGEISVDGALELVRQIESRKELMSVESIRLTAGTRPSLALDVASYYRIKNGGAPHAAP